MGNLYIPSRIKIGFQKRSDCYTGKLGYVIYYDDDNKLRKEKSWDGWRDSSIESVEFDNVKRSGYILNKGVQRFSDWGSGRSVIRVYDPRDFEFEISIDNLIGILMHSDVSKRDIQEECVFAWSGTELVLLPVNSVEYQESIEYTKKQALKLSTKDLIKGCRYHMKKQNKILTYIGFFDWWDFIEQEITKGKDNQTHKRLHVNKGKKHIFYDGVKFGLFSMSQLSSIVSNDVVENYAEVVDDFFKTYHSQRIVQATVVPCGNYAHGVELCKMKNDTLYSFYHYSSNYHDRFDVDSFARSRDVSVSHISYETSIVITQYYVKSYPNYSRFSVQRIHESFWEFENIYKKRGHGELTPKRVSSIMYEIGYGRLCYILENGTQILKK